MPKKNAPTPSPETELAPMPITENVRANAKKAAQELQARAARELDRVLDRLGLVRKSKAA